LARHRPCVYPARDDAHRGAAPPPPAPPHGEPHPPPRDATARPRPRPRRLPLEPDYRRPLPGAEEARRGGNVLRLPRARALLRARGGHQGELLREVHVGYSPFPDDLKRTRLNSSHVAITDGVLCLESKELT